MTKLARHCTSCRPMRPVRRAVFGIAAACCFALSMPATTFVGAARKSTGSPHLYTKMMPREGPFTQRRTQLILEDVSMDQYMERRSVVPLSLSVAALRVAAAIGRGQGTVWTLLGLPGGEDPARLVGATVRPQTALPVAEPRAGAAPAAGRKPSVEVPIVDPLAQSHGLNKRVTEMEMEMDGLVMRAARVLSRVRSGDAARASKVQRASSKVQMAASSGAGVHKGRSTKTSLMDQAATSALPRRV
eukprot:CAMPEP_0203851160 /NCGR_PEP_ID=MMETSP0359-20131031/7188_1 /ASSEMBLY_ACC=CAM_ASM_000338 /TAXON_ID=268821 /ORGANISM="Scrippsiella Hangoei, Strain SHTV-5" /LENGTH=244 /DNA_ID=CAMNT_0050767143 /DNA_START=97 /DNA_END=831 /DNA_ORIENTATION=-